MTAYLLYDFPRSSASYRVRIALHLKDIAFMSQLIDLRTGSQREQAFLDVNPAGLVPALKIPDGTVLTQSLAIMRYLDSGSLPRLFPTEPLESARVEAMALTIACDIHPLNNLRVLNFLESGLGAGKQGRHEWYRHWVVAGFASLEKEVARWGGAYCYGDAVTAADVCLVPQMANARRFEVDLSCFPRLVGIDARLRELPGVARAAPSA